MALKSTVYKAAVQVADMDRNVYATHALTLALHPSETEERLMVRVLAHALLADTSEGADALQAARGLSDVDEPDLWQHDLSGQLVHWIEVGQPDERRIVRACGAGICQTARLGRRATLPCNGAHHTGAAPP